MTPGLGSMGVQIVCRRARLLLPVAETSRTFSTRIGDHTAGREATADGHRPPNLLPRSLRPKSAFYAYIADNVDFRPRNDGFGQRKQRRR
jgi:hypothetical protein